MIQKETAHAKAISSVRAEALSYSPCPLPSAEHRALSKCLLNTERKTGGTHQKVLWEFQFQKKQMQQFCSHVFYKLEMLRLFFSLKSCCTLHITVKFEIYTCIRHFSASNL